MGEKHRVVAEAPLLRPLRLAGCGVRGSDRLCWTPCARKSPRTTAGCWRPTRRGDHKPGGERNPVLANGDPALTRDAADQYCDMVEGVLDFSISGGLTDAQRQDVQDLLVKDWKGMDQAAREDFLQTLQKWPSQERLLVQLRAGPASRSTQPVSARNPQPRAGKVRRGDEAGTAEASKP